MTLLILLLALSPAHAYARKAPLPAPTSIPSPIVVEPLPSPVPAPHGGFVTLGADTGSNVNVAFAGRALALMNGAVSSGCLKAAVESHSFLSLHSVMPTDATSAKEAYSRYVGGAPYALDLRWYKKAFSKVIGYTYNWLSDTDMNAPDGVSETHIWSNTKYVLNFSEAEYASHLAHELSHQGRAGGFVHYTFFTGSYPYDVGDLMAQCLRK